MINIGLCGFGTVGSGVYDIISTNEYFKDKVMVSKILVHNPLKHQDIVDLITTNYLDIINDKNIDVVIECIGGETLAYNIIKEAILNNKNVVTANKAVLMNHLIELTNLAKEHNVKFYFEASVCGAIPVIDTIQSINDSDPIESISGIINGSTNFVLTKSDLGLPFKESLDLASKLGFLEADPSDDLEGRDSLRKLVVLSNISFHTAIDYNNAYLASMANLSDDLILYAKKKGLKVKYIAQAVKLNDKVSLVIEPVVINSSHPLFNINNEMNSVSIRTSFAREIDLSGYGAGKYTTASAIMLDVNKILLDKAYYFDFNNNIETCGKVIKSNYLVHTKNINNKYVIKKYDDIYLTKELDSNRLAEVLKDSICYARVLNISDFE